MTRRRELPGILTVRPTTAAAGERVELAFTNGIVILVSRAEALETSVSPAAALRILERAA